MEGNCEYTEQAVTGIQQGVILQLGGWVRVCYEMSHMASDLIQPHPHNVVRKPANGPKDGRG
jgi:hypothetical protein